ncbi:glycosyltransferase family 2 protein [Frateuria sp. YIM B11624]|uniref:glycosyltransferase family 2 protein n=1 Tax=Frateuria sp. YIM B11624 TaxID=3143185 RepID=UPI003C77E183
MHATIADSLPLPAMDADTRRVAPVSVVVPCYRCADTIGPAVASVAAQRLPPAEVLLVDDCSGDGTLERLREVAAGYPAGWVKVHALPRNGGPSGARNLGWERATQPYIAFLDADDTWHPEKLAIQMDVLAADPAIALLAHSMNVQPRTAPAPPVRRPIAVRVLPNRLPLLGSPFPTASMVLRRDLPFRFDERRRRAEDFMLWAQILLSGYRCARIEPVLASWHKPPFGAGGLSGDMDAMYAAAIDVRRTLHAQGLIGGARMHVAAVLGVARYARRRVLTYARRFAGHPHATRADQAS